MTIKTTLSDVQKAKVGQIWANVQLVNTQLQSYLDGIVEDRGLLDHIFDIQKMEFTKKPQDKPKGGEDGNT